MSVRMNVRVELVRVSTETSKKVPNRWNWKPAAQHPVDSFDGVLRDRLPGQPAIAANEVRAGVDDRAASDR